MKRMHRVFGDLDALLYVDGRLEGDRKAAFLAHLAGDAQEADRVRLWSRQNEALRAAFGGIVTEPVPLWLRLGHVAGDGPARENAGGADRRPAGGARIIEAPGFKRAEAGLAPSPRRRPGSVGLTAVVLFVIAVLVMFTAHTLLPQPAATERAAATAEDGPGRALGHALDAYKVYALDPVRPVEIAAAEQPALDRWVEQRLSLALRPADLHAEGWTFLGGRLVAGEAEPAAFYVYESAAGDRLGLYMARSLAPATPTVTLNAAGSSGAAMSWVAGPVASAVVVGRSVDWLSRNAEVIRTRVARALPAD